MFRVVSIDVCHREWGWEGLDSSDEVIQGSHVGEFQQPGSSGNGLSWNGMEELEMWQKFHLLPLLLVCLTVASLP
jgi:hypothetical protein